MPVRIGPPGVTGVGSTVKEVEEGLGTRVVVVEATPQGIYEAIKEIFKPKTGIERRLTRIKTGLTQIKQNA